MPAPATSVNLAHLDALSHRIRVGGRELLATWIYADAPSYRPVGDPDEGIACVDDVARAAVAYLDEHARTGDPRALEQARAALEFVLYMQEPDGTFVNFITDLQGTKNRTHETSRAGLGWWAFRGMWALARGLRAFDRIDPAFAARLHGAVGRSEQALASELGPSGRARAQLHGRAVPAWLTRFPSDMASVAAIALAELQEARPNARTAALLGTLADGIAASRVRAGRDGAFDHAAHTITHPGMWHAWGAHQGEALARAGRMLGRPELVEAARSEVEGLLAWQLAAGRIHELRPGPLRSGQQAYGVAMAVRGAMELHRATGESRYARLAGLHASWFTGNNMARGAMYDPRTGRGYDGIDAEPRGINRSSGAESTIEAIMALQAIAGNADAQRMAHARPVGTQHTWTVVEPREVARVARRRAGERTTITVTVETPGTYHLLVANADGVLRRVPGASYRLRRGANRIEVAAPRGDGASPLRSLVLHPAVARTALRLPDRAGVDVTWKLDEGRLRITVDEP